jgi:predicted phosphodiesterase
MSSEKRNIRVRVSEDEYSLVREILQKKKRGGALPKITEIDNYVSSWLSEFPDGREETFNILNIEGKTGIVNDIHLGIHDKSAITTALTYFKKEKLDNLILNGDILDASSISRHPKTSGMPNFTYEINLAKTFLSNLQSDFPNVKIYFKEGNHEDRLQRYIMERAEQLDGLVDLETMLEFEKRNIHHVESLRYMSVNGIHVFHGHEIQVSGRNAVKRLYEKTAHSALMGHVHRVDHFVKKGTDEIYRDTYTVGCLCKLKQAYMMHSDSQHGMAIIEKDGHVRNHEIRNGIVL